MDRVSVGEAGVPLGGGGRGGTLAEVLVAAADRVYVYEGGIGWGCVEALVEGSTFLCL